MRLIRDAALYLVATCLLVWSFQHTYEETSSLEERLDLIARAIVAGTIGAYAIWLALAVRRWARDSGLIGGGQ